MLSELFEHIIKTQYFQKMCSEGKCSRNIPKRNFTGLLNIGTEGKF